MSNRTGSSQSPLPLSIKARRTEEAPVSTLMAAAIGCADLINLAAGFVDARTLPVEECSAIARKLFADRDWAQRALQYDTTQGLRELRQEALRHMERLEGRAASTWSLAADQILITTGSQQTLYLVADVLIDPGDIIITANPSYFVFTGTLQSLGAQVLPVPVDEQGMDTDAVERLLKRLEGVGLLDRVKFIYTTSYFDNPTGLTLSLTRRHRLLELVRAFSRRHRILIVEDAAYRELCYAGEPPLPSMKSMDEENRFTVLTQTFSKAFAPGLRVGYTAMPQDLLQAVLHQKGNHDFGSPSLCQHIAAEALRDGSYAHHVELLRREYGQKRDAMLRALDRHMPRPEGLSWLRPRGGLYVWLTLPESIDTRRDSAMFSMCVERGVLYVPGDYCFQPDEQGRVPFHHVRLSYGQVAQDRIEEGIARLGQVVRQLLDHPSQAPRLPSRPARSKIQIPLGGDA